MVLFAKKPKENKKIEQLKKELEKLENQKKEKEQVEESEEIVDFVEEETEKPDNDDINNSILAYLENFGIENTLNLLDSIKNNLLVNSNAPDNLQDDPENTE